MQPSSDQLLAALQSVQAGLGRYRPLSRVCQQLLSDLAVLLTGLRSVVMLDYAAGTTPQQLGQALQPLQQVLPDWPGCILELEGCCYVANQHQLLQHLEQLATDVGSWPAVVGFRGQEPQLLQQEGHEHEQLQQQLHNLHEAVVTGCRGAAGAGAAAAAANACVQQQQQQPQWPIVSLSDCQGLPAMPTLNGFLLGYPVVYHVSDHAEAAVASRMLSGSRLLLHTLVASCSNASGWGDVLTSSAQNSDVAAKGKEQACCSASIMAFTVPAFVVSAAVEAKVQHCVQKLRRQLSGPWSNVELHVECVGPQAVSL